MRSLAAYACAALLIGGSFASYASRFSPVNRWQADNYDPADYRLVAEHFWHVPFEPSTYDPLWHGPWGTYLRTVPFRSVGLGSLYLLVGVARVGHAPRTPSEVITTGIALAWIEKLVLAIALFTVFAVVRRRWGTTLALFALAITAWPPTLWRMSDDFLTEPVHRSIFLFAFACTVAMSGRKSVAKLAFVLMGLWLLATHLKVQWYVAPLLMLPVVLIQFQRVGVSLRTTVLMCVAAAMVPLSAIAVNWIGWRSASLSPGVGLHINLKYGGEVLREFSAANARNPNRPAFADLERPQLRWWHIYIGPDVSRQQYDAFDRYARNYLRARPVTAARAFWGGLGHASTVPGVERVEHGLIRLEPLDPPWATIVRCVDFVVWPLLVVGLFADETRLPCALGLVLWIVPALGHVVSDYELRYHLPMAGVGAAAASLVAARLVRREQPVVYLPAERPYN